MSRSRLRGLGLMTAALLAASVALGAPASAEGITGTIAGTITDGGAPVAFASVQIQSPDGSFFTSTATDDFGNYVVSEVPEAAAAYTVMIQVPAHPTQFYPGQLNWEQAGLVSVAGGQTTTVDDQLVPTGVIAGHLRDRDGNGVPNASVSAEPDGDGFGVGYTTDAEGAYALHVPPGTYRVAFSSGQLQYAFGTHRFEDATLFTVAVGQTLTVDDAVLPTGSLAGTVTTADGRPAADVFIQAEAVTGESATGSTGPDGSYRIDGVIPGTYTVRFQLASGASIYAHGAHSRDDAATFPVTADQVTTVDEQLPATGTIAGRFTDRAGHGVAALQVTAEARFPLTDSLYATTDADGNYRIDQAFPGQYTVSFQNFETQLLQYAFGKVSIQDADVVTVSAGQTTAVDDQQLPTGSLKLTAKDSITGAAIQSFFVDLGFRTGSTDNGELVVDDLAVGHYTINAGADGYGYVTDIASVTITAGNQSMVPLTLQPVGKVTTKVVDRKTGQPVAGICVFPASKTHFTFPDGCGARSDDNGNVTVSVDDPGTYNLFALPDRGSPYGAQWVGATGGTGQQDSAAKVVVKAGQTVAGPRIKLDRHGTIKGKVTSTTGQPLTRGSVAILGPDTGSGNDHRISPIGADGSYAVDFLGPYQWPLLFGAEDHAYQWSGRTGNRLTATLIQVTAGKATKFNYKMKVGTDVAITYSGPDTGSARYVVHNAVTGDVMGVIDGQTQPITVHGLVFGAQNVKIECDCGPGGSRWLGGTDFATATVVAIPATGTKEIAFPVS